MRGEGALVAVLFSVLLAQLAIGVRADGLTSDEVLYIAAGYRHLFASDYRLNPTTPPLAKLLAATGLVGMNLREPAAGAGEDELSWSYRFVNVDNDPARVVPRARLPVLLLTLALAGLVWHWARLTAGPGAGLLALALFAFHPSLLAHGHLATTDLPAAAFMLAASFAFWRWGRLGQARWAVMAGLAVGAATATRLTGWLLLPALALVAAIEAYPSAHRQRPRTRAVLVLVLALVLLPLVVVWAAHGFHRSPWPGTSVYEPAPPRLGLPGRLVEAAQDVHLLPEAYLQGARYQVEHGTSGHPAYLLGDRSRTGWWWYFVVAFAVKSTPGFLLAVLLGLGLRLRRHEGGPAPGAHWLVPAGLLFVAASMGRVQIGERYILAVHPYLILWTASVLAPRLDRRSSAPVLAVALLGHALPALWIAPRGYLAYFNAFAGGPDGGHRVLLDSNLDWGQDLPRLASWMRSHGVGTIRLAYHGADRPERYGIVHEDLPGAHLYPAQPAPVGTPGLTAISPNLLFGLFPRFDPAYEDLRRRPPDDRAGVFFIYRDVVAPAAASGQEP